MTLHNPTLKTALALLLAAGAVAPTAASANATAARRVREGSGFVSSPTRAYAADPAVRVVTVREGGGFDWGDATIGAGGGLGLSILGLAGGQVLTRRRDRRTTRSAAAIN